jgi:hypothetical protein
MSDFVITDEVSPTTKVSTSSTSISVEKKESIEELVEVFAIKAELLDSAVRIEYSPGLFKLVSYSDFLNIIRTNLDEKDGSKNKSEDYWLPSGTFFFQRYETGIKLCTYYPECVQNVNYRGNIRPTVVPNIIISSTLSKTNGGPKDLSLTDVRYYATKDPLGAIPRSFITLSSNVSLLPFTNVYEDARLCFGESIKISKYKLPDLRGVHSLYQVLFDAPFNNDLGLRALKDKFSRRDYSSWYDHLAKLAKEKKPFPYHELRIYPNEAEAPTIQPQPTSPTPAV